MAAILCRVFFVEPCKAMSKCCEGLCKCTETCCDGFCKCMGSCCDSFSRCCDNITALCDKPFSGCLIMTILINLVALIYGIIALTSGGSDCDDDQPYTVLLICLFICAIINPFFSYYMYYKLNRNEDMTTAKLWEFFKNDAWMAVYICFLIGMIALCIVSIVYSGECSSALSDGVLWTAVIEFIFLGVAILILFLYVAFEAFKQLANMAEKNWCWWFVCCCWPCLCIGCCLNWSDKWNDTMHGNNGNNRSNSYEAPDTNNQPPKKVVVVQQVPNQQPLVVRQPINLNQQQQPVQVVVHQRQPIQQQVYVAQPQQVPIQQPYNPQANNLSNPQPGVLVVHQTNQQPIQQQQQNNEDIVEYDEDSKALKVDGTKLAKEVGATAKKAGISAIGWMAKKVNQLNDKVAENKAAKADDTNNQEGNGY